MAAAHAICVLNLKGGVGKTHTIWLLTGVCVERRRRCLVVDLDLQGNISRTLLPDPCEGPGVEAVFDPRRLQDIDTLVRNTRLQHVDLVPAGPMLATFDLSDQRAWEQSELQFALATALEGVTQRYDIILFDCPPRLSLVSFAALCAAHHVIIPLEAADWGAQGIVQVTQAVEYVRQRYNPSLNLLGYLVSRFKIRRSFQLSYLAKLREHFGRQAFDTMVPDLARFEQSVALNVPIALHAPGSREARIARQLFDEVESRIRQSERVGPGRRRPVVRVERPVPV